MKTVVKCKHSFTCTVKSTVYTNPSRKRSFRIEAPLQTGGETDLKMPSLRVFQSGLSEFFFKQKFKMTGDCCVFKFLRGGVNRKHLMRFQSKNFRFQVSAPVQWGADRSASHKLAYLKRKEIAVMN